jgi:hypothetical protein
MVRRMMASLARQKPAVVRDDLSVGARVGRPGGTIVLQVFGNPMAKHVAGSEIIRGVVFAGLLPLHALAGTAAVRSRAFLTYSLL